MTEKEIKKKTIVAIGDIHGLDYWRAIVERHPDCLTVFLGDYLDPYDAIPRSALLDNLRAIIDLKKSRPDDVVLLLGNHDMHYFNPYARMGTRFDFGICKEASSLFLENLHLFRYAYQEGNKVFTHAGISQWWWQDDFHGDDTCPIAEQLNHPTEEQMGALCRVGYARGGEFGRHGGIFWADSSELWNPLHGYTQIVGHNPVPEITTREGDEGAKIVFCDSLRYGNYFFIDESKEL